MRVQGHLRPSMLIPLKSSSPMLVMISSMSVPNCYCFYARRANSSKITTFWGIPSLTPFDRPVDPETNPKTSIHSIEDGNSLTDTQNSHTKCPKKSVIKSYKQTCLPFQLQTITTAIFWKITKPKN